MIRSWALIQKGRVVAVIHVEFEVTPETYPDYLAVNVDDMDPMPETGGLYDATTGVFSPKPPPTPQEIIALLENQCSPRRLREAICGVDNGWLADLEAQIQAQRDLIPA